MGNQSRSKFSAAFKTKVVLEALKESQTIEVLAKTYELRPNQITAWQKEFLAKAGGVFEAKDAPSQSSGPDPKLLYARIGQLQVENMFLRKRLFSI